MLQRLIVHGCRRFLCSTLVLLFVLFVVLLFLVVNWCNWQVLRVGRPRGTEER